MFRFTGLTRASLFSRSPSRMKIPLVLDTDTQVALRVSQTSNYKGNCTTSFVIKIVVANILLYVSIPE
jgi:hypothetical protein